MAAPRWLPPARRAHSGIARLRGGLAQGRVLRCVSDLAAGEPSRDRTTSTVDSTAQPSRRSYRETPKRLRELTHPSAHSHSSGAPGVSLPGDRRVATVSARYDANDSETAPECVCADAFVRRPVEQKLRQIRERVSIADHIDERDRSRGGSNGRGIQA